jgi:hypothetical protein
MLESGEEDALDFIDEFKLNLHNEEIYVFTPNGDLVLLAQRRNNAGLCIPCAHADWFPLHWGQGQSQIGSPLPSAEQWRSGRNHHITQAKAQRKIGSAMW